MGCLYRLRMQPQADLRGWLRLKGCAGFGPTRVTSNLGATEIVTFCHRAGTVDMGNTLLTLRSVAGRVLRGDSLAFDVRTDLSHQCTSLS